MIIRNILHFSFFIFHSRISPIVFTKGQLVHSLFPERWFWISLGFIGYLFSLYGIILGLGFGWMILLIPFVVLPLFINKFTLRERLSGLSVAALFFYFVLLVLLVRNSYFPNTSVMVVELFFILLVTIPAFLMRGPFYSLFGIGSVDHFLIAFGVFFLILFALAIWKVPKFHTRNRSMLFAALLLSIFITFNECIYLGQGIKHLSAISNLDPSVRNYYRVAVVE